MVAHKKVLEEILNKPLLEKREVHFLHQLLRKKIKNSFLSLIKEVQKAIGKEYKNALELINNLDNKKRFSPLLYFDYFSLSEAMLEQNKDKVIKICLSINASRSIKYYSADSLLIDDNSDNPIFEYYQTNALKSLNRTENFKKLTSLEFHAAKNNILLVLDIIQQTNNTFYDAVIELLSIIHISKGSFHNTASTSLRYFGMIILRYVKFNLSVEQILYFFDSIVHEATHIYLNLLMTFDPIVINSKEQYFSPARNTLRPMKGIFHAHMVFFRLISMYRLAEKFIAAYPDKQKNAKNLVATPIADLPYQFYQRLYAYECKFKQGEEIILNHAKLTKIGSELFQNLIITN